MEAIEMYRNRSMTSGRRSRRRPRGKGRCLPVLLMLMLLLPATAAATDEDAPFLEMSLEDLMEVEVVYGVSKYEQRASDAPASITIIRAEEIALHGYRTLAEVLSNVRGFYTSYDRNYNYLGVRGFGRPGDYNTRVLVLIDGHRQNDNIYSASSVGTEFCLDLDVIDRIEVIRGPGSSIYGTNAMFGVINIITKTTSERASIEGATGPDGLRSGRFVASGGATSPLKWMISGSEYRRSGDDLFYENFNTSKTNFGVAHRVDKDEYKRFFARGEWHGLGLITVTSDREKTLPTGAWGTVFNDPRNRTIDRFSWVGLDWSRGVGGTVDLWAAAGYHRYEYRGDYVYEDYAATDPEAPGTIILKDMADGSWWTAESRAALQTSPRSKITVGFEGVYSGQERQKTLDPYGLYLDEDRPAWTWGCYLQEDFSAADWAQLSVGARLDRYKRLGSTLNPRGSVVLSPSKGSRLKLIYGTAFRAPNAYELYYSDGGYSAKPSLDLEPERIHTVGSILEQYLGNNSFGSVEYFRFRMSDLIENRVDPADSLLVFDNRGRAEAEGIEFGVRREWAGGVVGRCGLVFQRAVDGRTDERLSNSPGRLGYLSASVPVLMGRGGVALDLRYVGDRATLDGGKVESYWVTDVAGSVWVVPQRLRLVGRVTNLLNATYSDPGSEEHLQPSIEQDRRGWRLSMSASL